MIPLINKPLEYCLKIGGFWPNGIYVVGPVATVSSLFTTIPFQCWETLSLVDAELLMDSLSDIFAEVLILFKFIIMWANKSKISSILKEIFSDWENKKIPDEWKIFARHCNVFCTVDIILYLSATFLYYPEVILSYFNNAGESRKLYFRSSYPFNYHVSPMYETINIMQMAQGLLMITIDSLSKGLLVAMILHVCAHIELLKGYIEVYSKNCTNNITSNNITNFKRIVEQHVKILVLVQKIDSAYSYISLIQIVFSNLIICVTGFVIITAMQSANIILVVKFIGFIIVMLSEALAFCFAGQYLRNQGESIVHAVYGCLWYNTKPKDIKGIMFVLARAQTPLTLYGGKLFELSTNSFTMILKTSVSYLSVLRAVYA